MFDIVKTSNSALWLVRRDNTNGPFVMVANLERTNLAAALRMRDALNAGGDSQTPDVKTESEPIDLIDTDPSGVYNTPVDDNVVEIHNADGSFAGFDKTD